MRTAYDASGPLLAPHQRAASDRLIRILSIRRGAVLADEPGLGKTWVAATVAAGIGSAGVDVIVPAALRSYWKEVLAAFGVEAAVMSHEILAQERMQRGDEPAPGLVIVDEAHRFRNPLTKRYEGLARMSVSTRLLLVTATPVCNSPADLLSLLDLIVADDELADLGVPSVSDCVVRGGNGVDVVMRQLVVRRRRRELVGLTPARRKFVVQYEPAHVPEGMLESLTFPWMGARINREIVLFFLQRRLESSVAALAATIRRMTRICRRARHLAERGASLSASDLRAVLGDPDTQAFQDILFAELWGAGPGVCAVGEFDEEARRLEVIAGSLPADGKLDVLEEIVEKRRGVPGLVFTVSFDTAMAVFERLSKIERCALLTGRRCLVRSRRVGVDAVVGALSRGEIDLVIATDVGGEGLNLQAAGYVVHYDQPWNPAVIEQRNGRIRRMGQGRAEVEFVELTTGESRSLRIIAQKREAAAELWSRAASGRAPSNDGGWRPPSRLEAGCAASRLSRLLRSRGLFSGELAGLLSTRQRVGVERLLERIARGPIDAREVERLLSILRRERAMIPDHGAAI